MGRKLAAVMVLALAGCAAERSIPPAAFWTPGRLLPPIGLLSAPEAKATAQALAAPPLGIALGPGGRAITVSAEERDQWIVHPLAGFDLDAKQSFAAVTVLVPGASGETPFAATDEGAVLAAAPLVRAREGEQELDLQEPSLLLLGFEGKVRWHEPLRAGFCGIAGDRAGGVWVLTDGVAERRDARNGKLLARVEVGHCGKLSASDEGDALLIWDAARATLVGAGGAIHRRLEASPGSPFTWGGVGPTLALLRVSPFGGILAVPRGGGLSLLVAEGRVEAPTGEKLKRVPLVAGDQIGTALEVRGRLVVTTEDRLRAYGSDGTLEKTLALSCPGTELGAVGCHAVSSAAAPGGTPYLVLARLRARGSAGEPIVDLTGGWLVAMDPGSFKVRWRATLSDVVPDAVGRAGFANLRGPWRHEDAVLAWRPSRGLLWYRP